MLYMYNKYIYLNMLAVRIPKEIEDRLDSLSKKTGRTKSFYIRQALDEYLEELEDVYLAEERLTDKKRQMMSLQQLEEYLDV